MNLSRNARPFPWGLGFITAVALIILLAISINVNFGLPFNISLSFPPGQDYTLKAAFKDVNGLARGASVTEAGHEVGEVTGIATGNRTAIVTMRIHNQYAPLHQGTIARLRYSTLLAQKYVELSPGSSFKPEISGGGIVGVDETITPVDFDQFLSSFDPETRARLQDLIQQAGGGVAGQQTNINDLLDQLHGLSMESRAGLSTLHTHDPDLDRIVLNLAVTSDELAKDRVQLGDFIQQTNDVNRTIANQDVALATFINHLTNVMADFDATLAGNEQNMHQTIVTLDPTLVELNGLVRQTFVYYDAYKGELTSSAEMLIPFIGSAISQQDANGNYLRQYLACPQSQESSNPNDPKNGHWDPSCGTNSSGSPGNGGAQPHLAVPSSGTSQCPIDAVICTPATPTLPGLPVPTPSPSPGGVVDPSILISPSPVVP